MMGDMLTRAELFALWQEADDLANVAEGIISAQLVELAKGEGPGPTPTHVEAAKALRETARARLQAAGKAFREPIL